MKKTDLWATPKHVFDWVFREFRGEVDLDVCASPHNAKCPRFITEEENCLTRDWDTDGYAWCNPPYSNPKPFIEKAIEQMKKGNKSVFLVKLDTSTKWFRLCEENATAIIPVVGGRIQFLEYEEGKRSSNNFCSVFVVFEEECPFPFWSTVDIRDFGEPV